MFALRSSPSSLVCDLRNTLLPAAAEGGFQLSVPRPRRATVRLGFDIYYAGGGADGETDVGPAAPGGGGGAFSPAVSDYAGVFEAGDPARARESMNNHFGAGEERASGLVKERAPNGAGAGGDLHRESGVLAAPAVVRGRGGGEAEGSVAALDDGQEEGGGGVEDDGGGLEEDFLFEMEGLKEFKEDQEERGMRGGGGGGVANVGRAGGGIGEGWGAAAASAASAAAAAAAYDRGSGGSGAAPPKFHGTPTYASVSPSSAGKQVGAGAVVTGAAGVGGAAALRKPRVIAPRGTRCIGGGMYRLRLSTSC